jgi:hypothetical protein
MEEQKINIFYGTILNDYALIASLSKSTREGTAEVTRYFITFRT